LTEGVAEQYCPARGSNNSNVFIASFLIVFKRSQRFRTTISNSFAEVGALCTSRNIPTGSILDEGNRMSEKSWASLAPLLDRRRYVESLAAGVKIRAHGDFRFVATMNDDASTFDLPEYIHSRLMPMILFVGDRIVRRHDTRTCLLEGGDPKG